jgi:hypothetical protein
MTHTSFSQKLNLLNLLDSSFIYIHIRAICKNPEDKILVTIAAAPVFLLDSSKNVQVPKTGELLVLAK